MALSTNLQAKLSILWKVVDTVNDKVRETENVQQTLTAKEAEHQDFFVDGAATTNLTLNTVGKASAYMIVANSRYNGNNSTTDNAVAPVTMALGGGTAYKSNILVIGSDLQMAASGNATVAIRTVADTDTHIQVFALGIL
jgi:hypothetical protein